VLSGRRLFESPEVPIVNFMPMEELKAGYKRYEIAALPKNKSKSVAQAVFTSAHSKSECQEDRSSPD